MNRKALIILAISLILISGCDFVVGNFVWHDENMNGLQDPKELGIPGVTVRLYEVGGNAAPVAMTTTDAAGMYAFTFPGGDKLYFVEFELPAGYQFSAKDVGVNDFIDSDAFTWNGRSQNFSAPAVPGESDDPTIDAGMVLILAQDDGPAEVERFVLGDFVWNDLNADGIQDEGEGGMADVRVDLEEVDLGNNWSTVTDAQGFYEFADLPEGVYQLQFFPPEGFDLTLAEQGPDRDLDSDADPDTGLSSLIAVDLDWPDFDAGLVQVQSSGPASYCVGPEVEDFPTGYSPLTGQMVNDPSLLDLRPVFVSVSLFPASSRPPTGAASAPIAYQFYIGDGDTRMLLAFYGEFPELPTEFNVGNLLGGELTPPWEIADDDFAVGNWVWFDTNGNSLQDAGEPGFPDIEVSIYVNGVLKATTTTDVNGYYWFSLSEPPGSPYRVKFSLPAHLPGTYAFVEQNASSDESIDSDANIVTGWTGTFHLPAEGNTIFLVDAGIRQIIRIEGVRSGRIFYEDIRVQYCGCLITAGADPVVAAQIQTCAFAVSSDPNNIGASGVELQHLGNIAQQSSTGNVCSEPNLSGNLFCTEAPQDGANGSELFTYWNINNRDHFVYTPSMAAYTWAKNLPSANETFEIMKDGLTGETLYYENVVVMLVNHTMLNAAGTIVDMELQTTTGKAYIFRNGQMYAATWSTLNGPYEQATGLLRPYRFMDSNGDPFPFAPGQTFVQMLHTFHGFEELSPGVWKARFFAPVFTP